MTSNPYNAWAQHPSYKPESLGRSAEKHILGYMHQAPPDMAGAFSELFGLKHQEPGRAFNADLRRINHDLQRMGLLPHMSIVDNHHGGFDVAPNYTSGHHGGPHRHWRGQHHGRTENYSPSPHQHHGYHGRNSRRLHDRDRDRASQPDVSPPAVPRDFGNDIPIAGRPTITAQKIDEVLARNHSPAAGLGEFFMKEGERTGINPAYALAFFEMESSFGKLGAASKNNSIGNIRGRGAGGYQHYASWEEGTRAWFNLIKDHYVGDGPRSFHATTLPGIIKHYAPRRDHNNEEAYVAQVRRRVREWADA
jgi:hypothetical protein